MLTQLDPPIPMTVEDKGPGFAIAVIDYSAEHDLLWVVALDATGEIWAAPNPKVRLQSNWSMGRLLPPKPEAAKETKHEQPSDTLRKHVADLHADYLDIRPC